MDLSQEAAFHLHHADVIDFLLEHVHLISSTRDDPEANQALQDGFELLLERVPLDAIIGIFTGTLTSVVGLLAEEKMLPMSQMLLQLKALWRD